MNTTRTFALFALICLLAPVSAQAQTQAQQAQQAQPVAAPVTPGTPAGTQIDTLAHLDAQIALDRQARPELYAAVETLRLQAPWMAKNSRGPLAVMGPAFTSLGPDATLAVVDALLRDDPLSGAGVATAQPPAMRRAWRVGMLNALRSWRQPLARPALEWMLDSSEKDTSVIRATAEALGILMDDRAVDFLLARADGRDARSLAIASALGMCRRAEVAGFLATRVGETSGETRAVYLESLGDVANSWAWKTDVVAASGESELTRIIARDALVALYLDSDGNVAKEATKNLLLADAPGTVELLERTRLSSTTAQRARIDTLLQRVRNNPLNRRR